jgi:hypothetical protein
MDLMLNYVMRYGSSLQEILVSKLTAFYNQLVLKYPSRLIIMMPYSMKIHQVDRHKVTFDEVTVVKFNPADTQFWNTSRLVYFLYYLSSFGMSTKHLYIDYGKVFPQLDVPDELGDVLVAGDYTPNPETLEKVQNKLDVLGFENLTFPIYHFGVFHAADSCRALFQSELKQILEHYDEFVNEDTCYILLSYALSNIEQKQEVTVTELGELPADISGCPMVDDFYVLI